MKIFHDPFIRGAFLYNADGNRWFCLEESGIRHSTVSDLVDGICQKNVLRFEPATVLPVWAVEQVLEIQERDWQEIVRQNEARTS